MSQSLAPPAAPPPEPLPRNVKVLGLASLLNDTASEMIYPLLPHFLLTGLGGGTASPWAPSKGRRMRSPAS